MKLYTIIPIAALFSGALASNGPNAHGLEDLVARGIDPKTMDPTRLSVLSVLRTAIPSGSDFPQPTGDFEPDWYRKLPEDVKSLLPSLYPVTSTEASSRATTSVPVSAPATEMVNTVVSSIAVSNNTFLPSVTSQLAATKTLQDVPPTVTGSRQIPSTVANGTLANATQTAPAPSFTGGANAATRAETLAALAWIGVAAGFVFFA